MTVLLACLSMHPVHAIPKTSSRERKTPCIEITVPKSSLMCTKKGPGCSGWGISALACQTVSPALVNCIFKIWKFFLTLWCTLTITIFVFLFENLFFLILCEQVFCLHVCLQHNPQVQGVRRGHWSWRGLLDTILGSGNQHSSSRRAAAVLRSCLFLKAEPWTQCLLYFLHLVVLSFVFWKSPSFNPRTMLHKLRETWAPGGRMM